MRLARAMVLAVVLVSNLSLGQLRAQNQQPIADSPGTPPLQGTPATDDNKPAESKPGGTRPTTPAPAEKTAPPIKDE